ncbi:MAG: magnesium transporter CorA family protein [Bacteroidales bacterium]|nr:magnesium transporter CorA family protein [Bacteroidales bacterium]
MQVPENINILSLDHLHWIHIPDPTDEAMDFLQSKYDFHSLDIEDCQAKVQRPKIDIYEDYRFLILHFPYFDKELKFVKTKEVKIFWGPDYIITIGKSHWVIRKLFQDTKTHAEIDVEELDNTSDALLYTIFDALMEDSFRLLRMIEDNLEKISLEMFKRKPENIIEDISVTRKNLILLNTTFKPQLRLFQKFESGLVKGFSENMENYWGDVLDAYQKMWDSIEDYQELIQGLAQTFDSLQTNKTNEIIKILTVFSALWLPLTFFTGLYGMNVDLPFQNHKLVFLGIGGFLIIIIILLLIYFKKRRWI